MHLVFRNVNDAFRGLVRGIHDGSISTDVRPSRYGEVLRVTQPLVITYKKPLERVLFNSARDVNPFSLLYEATYMLAGRNDVAPLTYYTKRFAEFSDDGVSLNDAYGRRWRRRHVVRHGFPGRVDQLDEVVGHLKAYPWSRRAVVQMWDVGEDLLKVNTSRAVCCNLNVLFAVEPGLCRACEGTGVRPADDHTCLACRGKPHDQPRYLNMTVTNRSNDMLWGLLGANYVTFSVLQEYVAARLGLEVGVYHHFTNDLHTYTARWKPREWLAEYDNGAADDGQVFSDEYPLGGTVPLVANPETFEGEVKEFVERHRDGNTLAGDYAEPFLARVAQPACVAFHHYKEHRIPDALLAAGKIRADDWRVACEAWLRRRADRRAARKGVGNVSE